KTPTLAQNPVQSPPQYDLDIQLDVAGRCATVRERVTWINPCTRPAAELVFNAHSHFRLPKEDVALTAKTLEILRLGPGDALVDPNDPAPCEIKQTTLLAPIKSSNETSAEG